MECAIEITEHTAEWGEFYLLAYFYVLCDTITFIGCEM